VKLFFLKYILFIYKIQTQSLIYNIEIYHNWHQ